jgi:hypothetical protein
MGDKGDVPGCYEASNIAQARNHRSDVKAAALEIGYQLTPTEL